MARITVEDCLERVSNRFSLVMLVSQRAKQIMKGSSPMIDSKDNKAIVTSLREVAAGKVWYEINSEENGTADQQIERDLTR
ncbi:MAG: DNA-directed RNA polymerase subunit omega [Oligoflexia bacterium]|nr:DNA-directed RNA polymerase subunit omega [Oligoflexia bacterium]